MTDRFPNRFDPRPHPPYDAPNVPKAHFCPRFMGLAISSPRFRAHRTHASPLPTALSLFLAPRAHCVAQRFSILRRSSFCPDPVLPQHSRHPCAARPQDRRRAHGAHRGRQHFREDRHTLAQGTMTWKAHNTDRRQTRPPSSSAFPNGRASAPPLTLRNSPRSASLLDNKVRRPCPGNCRCHLRRCRTHDQLVHL